MHKKLRLFPFRKIAHFSYKGDKLKKEDYSLDLEVEEALDKVLNLLEKNDIIQEFKYLEMKIAENQHLNDLVEAIKFEQKEAVQFAHYEKPQAEKFSLQQADHFTKQFEEHPLVVRYREVLKESNELLHFVTDTLEQEINQYLDNATEEKEIKK